MSVITALALLVFLTIPEGFSIVVQGPDRCHCINKESRPIGRLIGQVKVHEPSSHCQEREIIATLKKDGEKICLDPNAPWVRKTLERQRAMQVP